MDVQAGASDAKLDNRTGKIIWRFLKDKGGMLGSARGLANALKKANAVRTELKEHENVEHMIIVREAAPDVFWLWEGK